MDLALLLGKIGVSPALTQDISLLLVVTVFSLIFSMFIGRYKLVTILVNIYVAFAVTTVLPMQFFTDYLYRLVFFLALVVVLTLLDKKLFEVYISGSGTGFLWWVFVMSFLEVIFLLSIVLVIVPKKIALSFVSPAAMEYLISENARFIWMVVPLIFMVFIHKRLNR
ncbi:MAG: hypothetical protein WC823_07290 [Parcubacteria group bacterium]|jgi:hypothetical protein